MIILFQYVNNTLQHWENLQFQGERTRGPIHRWA